VGRDLATHDISPTVGEPLPAPDAALDHADWPERLQHAIAALPDRYRTVAVLRWKHGLEYDQIARILGVTEPTARQLVTRTLKTLRSAIGV